MDIRNFYRGSDHLIILVLFGRDETLGENSEAAELTWENGQLAMRRLVPPRVPAKTVATKNSAATTTKYTWEKPRTSGTLESIPNGNPPLHGGWEGEREGGNELAPWFVQQRAAAVTVAAAASVTLHMDALVPCSNPAEHLMDPVMEAGGLAVCGGGTCMEDCPARVGSCSGPAATMKEWSGRDQSASGSGTFGWDSQCMSNPDTDNMDSSCVGFTSTSMGSTEITTTSDDHDSICQSRPQAQADDEVSKKKGIRISSISTKRSRAAAIHNQYERKRRYEINQKMKTLQNLIPNYGKETKEAAWGHHKEPNMPYMMFPMNMQQEQQLQMPMMAPMGMDMNTIGRPNIPAIPSVISHAFVPVAAFWDGSGPSGSGNRTQASPASFVLSQSQMMSMDAYNRMAALYQPQPSPFPPPSSSSDS